MGHTCWHVLFPIFTPPGRMLPQSITNEPLCQFPCTFHLSWQQGSPKRIDTKEDVPLSPLSRPIVISFYNFIVGFFEDAVNDKSMRPATVLLQWWNRYVQPPLYPKLDGLIQPISFSSQQNISSYGTLD